MSDRAPSAFANLAPGASAEALLKLEAAIGQALPPQLRELLALNDGQVSNDSCCVLPGLTLLSCRSIEHEWSVWAKLRASQTADELESLDDACRSLDAGVLDIYTHPSWIPLLKDGWRSDYLGLDLAPTHEGHAGQVINFGRDEEQHFVAFPDLAECLAFWLTELEAGRCRELPANASNPVPWFEHEDGNSLEVLRARRAAAMT
jgi:cell wall assembly regulator SMI1